MSIPVWAFARQAIAVSGPYRRGRSNFAPFVLTPTRAIVLREVAPYGNDDHSNRRSHSIFSRERNLIWRHQAGPGKGQSLSRPGRSRRKHPGTSALRRPAQPKRRPPGRRRRSAVSRAGDRYGPQLLLLLLLSISFPSKT